MVGISGGDKEPTIDYRERARLVLPPKMALPPPGAGVPKSAAWPVDPDLEKIRKDKEAKKTILQSQAELQEMRDGHRLSPEQLRADRAKPGERHSAEACAAQSNKRGCDFVPFRNVLETFGFSKTDVVAGEEPDRDWLTDPPKGYRMPTASTVATFDEKKKESNDPRAELYKAPEQQ